MVMHPASPWLAVAIALAPAVLRLVWGRPLARLIDDPVLPERLAANRRRNTQAVAASFAVLVVGFTAIATWTVPLMLIARGVAGYPLRKQLYGETWSPGAYLWFFSRLVIAMFGFWILLAVMPTFAFGEGDRGWMLSTAAAAVLIAWHVRSADVLRVLLRVRPIADKALLTRFHSMVAAAGIPTPRFDFLDMNGGVLANAVAVPSIRRPGVIFTDTLLARLDADEITAICGHELAHLEHYNRARLRRLDAATVALVAIGAVLGPLTRLYLPSARTAASFTWPVLLLAFLIWRARDRQRNETASDVRAVQLCGDADALARALTKLHAFARIPRRWDREREQQATHPSLARRLRDIRAAAGARTHTLEQAATFAAADGSVTVTFDGTHVSWQEGDAATHRFSYGHLTELRLDARPTGVPRLVAVESTGRRWEIALPAGDVRRAQDVLDVVDGSLAHAPAAPRIAPGAARVAAAVAALFACTTGQFAFALVAALAALRPGAQLLAAAGLAGLMAAALAARDASWMFSLAMALPVALAAGVLCWIAWSQRDQAPARPPGRVVPLFAILSAVGCLLLFADGFSAVRIHQAAKTMYLGPVMLFALAGGLAMMRTPRARPAALAAAALGAVIAAIGSPFFLERFGRDPFLVLARPLTFAPLAGTAVSEAELGFFADDLRISTHGRSIAVLRREHDDQSEDASTFHVGPATGPLTAITADDVAFVDDERLVTMTIGADGADVRMVRIGSPGAGPWRVHIDALESGTLSVDANRGTWRVLASHLDRARQIVRAQGRIGDRAVDVARWDGSGAKAAWITAAAASDRAVVAAEHQFDRRFFGVDSAPVWIVPFMSMQTEARIWRAAPDGASELARSQLHASCTDAADPGALVCSAFDGVATRLLRIDAATGRITPVGIVDGRFTASGGSSPGWVTGWLSSGPAALRLAPLTGVRVERAERATSIAAGTDAIGTVSYGANGSVVRIYRF